jgi:hypothetical protein
MPLALGLAALVLAHAPASAQGCPRGYDASCGYCIPNNPQGTPHCPSRGGYYGGGRDGYYGGRGGYGGDSIPLQVRRNGQLGCPRGFDRHRGRCYQNANQ